MWPDAGFSFLIPFHGRGVYDVLKDFQGGLVGILGFGGVMITLLYNARTARAVRQQVIVHERTTLRVALSVELKMIANSLKGIQESLVGPAPDPEPGTPAGARETAPLLPFEIYSANLGKLGLLDPYQVDAVILAYSTLKSLQAGLKPNEIGPNRGFYLVQREWIDPIYRVHGYALKLIADAIESLKERE